MGHAIGAGGDATDLVGKEATELLYWMNVGGVKKEGKVKASSEFLSMAGKIVRPFFRKKKNWGFGGKEIFATR